MIGEMWNVTAAGKIQLQEETYWQEIKITNEKKIKEKTLLLCTMSQGQKN